MRVINIPTGDRVIRSVGQQWVAVEDFLDSDGHMVKAGVTICSGEADCVRERPDAFTRWDGSTAMLDRIVEARFLSGAAAIRVRHPRLSRSRFGFPPSTREACRRSEVRVAPTARQRMLDELFYLTRSDGLEAGGFLFGPRTRSFVRQLSVMTATPTGDAERGTHAMSLDPDMARSAEAMIERGRLDDVLVGIWHSHPNTRDTTPSDSDLAALQRCLDIHEGRGREAAYAVGLTFAASPAFGDSWARPLLDAWVLRQRPYGAPPICEKAAVLRSLY